MAYRIPVEIFVGEIEWQIIKDNNIDVVSLCTDAVKTRLDALNVMKAAVHSATSTHVEVQALRIENERLKAAVKTPVMEIVTVKKTTSPTPTSITQRAMKMTVPKKVLNVEDLYE
jgi:hypothetical protein